MDDELQQFNHERAERIRMLHIKHEKEIETFDSESARMGFRYFFFIYGTSRFVTKKNINKLTIYFSALALAEASKETYPDEEGSLSGSMISLAHSNSSTSFPAGSL